MDRFTIRRGSLVFAGARKLEILECVSPGKIKARDLATGEIVTISPGDIEFEFEIKYSDSEALLPKKTTQKPTIDSFSEDEMKVAEFRYNTLLPLLSRKPIPKNEIAAAGKTLNLSVSQIYRLLSLMEPDKGFVSLIQKKKGRSAGMKQIDGVVEDLIKTVIDDYYEGRAITTEAIYEIIRKQCITQNLPVPSLGTVSSRIKERPRRELLTKTVGKKAADQELSVRGGKILPTAPYELIQIDHALVDCIIVDGETRRPLGRPWATLAIDVYTRAVAGVHLSLSPPSSMSVALCISHTILPKNQWLKAYGLDEFEYPFYGVPKRIHVDNAKEFRSSNLQNSCRWYRIGLTYRPRRVPHNGAHIERLIGTFMKRVHLLPGATMSSVKERGDYDSEKTAALSFAEFREWFITEIEKYHKKKHSAIGCSPLFQWERYYKADDGVLHYPQIIEDRRRLLIDFMPIKKRRISRSGIKLNCVEYYSAALKRFDINTRCQVRYDPEAIGKIWVLPEGESNYIELTYSDVRFPNVTLAEFKHARKQLAAESDRRVTAAETFALIKKNDDLVERAVSLTKQTRKMNERKKIRSEDPGHPLNRQTNIQPKPANVDYARKPTAFDIED
nr:Mu transposase C-terminal domain-containing protein [Pseudomonas sp. Marseille-Q3773]